MKIYIFANVQTAARDNAPNPTLVRADLEFLIPSIIPNIEKINPAIPHKEPKNELRKQSTLPEPSPTLSINKPRETNAKRAS